MKIALRVTSLLFIASVAVLLSTCSLAAVSISDRISMFIQSLNGDRTDTYKNLDPNLPNPSAFDASYWEIYFPSGQKTFVYTSSNGTSNPSDVEGYIAGSGYPSTLHKFVMVNVGSGADDWRINSLQHGATFAHYPNL